MGSALERQRGETGRPADERVGPLSGLLERSARQWALAGGLVLLAAAGLTVVSGLSRWFTSQPVRGDFEIISIASGLAVLSSLAWCAARRGNILVDSFTGWLPPGVNRVIDGFWQLVWAAVMGVIAWRMTLGGLEAMRNGTRTIGLLALPYGWAIAVGAFCFGMTALIALSMAFRRPDDGA